MKFLCVLSVLCGLAIRGFGLDREAFTFTNYDLEVRVEPEQRRLAVRGKIILRNDSSVAQKNLSLQISSSLTWLSIQLEGKPVQFVSQPYTSDIDHTGALSEAIVTLPKEIPPKGSAELEIGYEGTVSLDTTRLTRIGVPEEAARHTDWDQISKSFTAVRGVGYVVWYPVAMDAANLSEGNSVFEALGKWISREALASARVNLCAVVPKASLGTAEPTVPYLLMNDPPQTEDHGGGYDGTVCSDKVFQALGARAPLFATNEYSDLNADLLEIFYFLDHKSGAENYSLAAQLAAPLVTEWFGSFKGKAKVVELADPEAAPYESGSMLLAPLKSTDSRLYGLTAVHQLTHAAFPSPRPWIYEGLAHFAQALYREQQNGRQAALDFMALHRAALADAEKAIAAGPANAGAKEPLVGTSVEEFYRSKAMYVWWMLRDIVGEEALKKALAAYRPEEDKEPSYIEHLIEMQTKREVAWFFDDWVYHDRGLPDFRVESAYSGPAENGVQVVTVSIENLGGAGAEVPVTLRMHEGEVTKRLVVRAKSKAAIRMEAVSKPIEITVNDGSVPESEMSNNTYKIESLSQ